MNSKLKRILTSSLIMSSLLVAGCSCNDKTTTQPLTQHQLFTKYSNFVENSKSQNTYTIVGDFNDNINTPNKTEETSIFYKASINETGSYVKKSFNNLSDYYAYAKKDNDSYIYGEKNNKTIKKGELDADTFEIQVKNRNYNLYLSNNYIMPIEDFSFKDLSDDELKDLLFEEIGMYLEDSIFTKKLTETKENNKSTITLSLSIKGDLYPAVSFDETDSTDKKGEFNMTIVCNSKGIQSITYSNIIKDKFTDIIYVNFQGKQTITYNDDSEFIETIINSVNE